MIRETLSGPQIIAALTPKRNNRGVADKQARTYMGILYQSKAEAVYAAGLDVLVKVGHLKSWERQVPYRLEVDGRLICIHKIDFKEWKHDGSFVLTEVKGHATEMWKLKKKLLFACYPGIAAYYKLVQV